MEPLGNRICNWIGIPLTKLLILTIICTLAVKCFQPAQAQTPLSFSIPADQLKIDLKFPESSSSSASYDIARVCRAISFSETSGCRDGTAEGRRNCVGLMTWEHGYREPKYYQTKADSLKDCERVWSTYYGQLPDLHLATKWTGADNSAHWLQTFWVAYNNNMQPDL